MQVNGAQLSYFDPRLDWVTSAQKKGIKHACCFRLQKSEKEHERVREAAEKCQPGRRRYNELLMLCYKTNVTFIFGTKSLIKDEEVLIFFPKTTSIPLHISWGWLSVWSAALKNIIIVTIKFNSSRSNNIMMIIIIITIIMVMWRGEEKPRRAYKGQTQVQTLLWQAWPLP